MIERLFIDCLVYRFALLTEVIEAEFLFTKLLVRDLDLVYDCCRQLLFTDFILTDRICPDFFD